MRSALFFRRYSYSEPEAIHDDGIVLGVRPAEQSEYDTDVARAQNLFEAAFRSTVKIGHDHPRS